SPGLAAAPTDNRYAPRPRIPELPAYVVKALRSNPKAWRCFQQLAPTYRRDFVVWVYLPQPPETRGKRDSASHPPAGSREEARLEVARSVRHLVCGLTLRIHFVIVPLYGFLLRARLGQLHPRRIRASRSRRNLPATLARHSQRGEPLR